MKDYVLARHAADLLKQNLSYDEFERRMILADDHMDNFLYNDRFGEQVYSFHLDDDGEETYFYRRSVDRQTFFDRIRTVKDYFKYKRWQS